MKQAFDEVDDLFDEAIKIVSEYDRASASLIQRRLRVGYARAARMLDELEVVGIVGAGEGSKPRDVLIKNSKEYFENPSKYILNHPRMIIHEKEEFKEIFKIKPLKSLPASDFKKVFENFDLSSKKDEIIFGFNQDKLVHASLEEINNLLIVGSLSSGKELFLDTLILSLLYQKSTSQTSIIVADSRHDTDIYSNIPNLLTPVISDHDKFLSALQWSLSEADRRYKLFNQLKTRSLSVYNNQVSEPFYSIIFIIRNSEDFLFSWDDNELLERAISIGNKAGIYFFIFTDRLTAKNVPTSIQSNIPNRLVFRTADKRDSSLAGVKDAEKLVSKTESIIKLHNEEVLKIDNLIIPEQEIRQILGFVS